MYLSRDMRILDAFFGWLYGTKIFKLGNLRHLFSYFFSFYRKNRDMRMMNLAKKHYQKSLEYFKLLDSSPGDILKACLDHVVLIEDGIQGESTRKFSFTIKLLHFWYLLLLCLFFIFNNNLRLNEIKFKFQLYLSIIGFLFFFLIY